MAPAAAANTRATHATTATASTKCTRIATNAPASAKQQQQAHQQTRWLVNQKEEWDVPHRYVLERALGSGSYGTVVVARDSARDDLPVAIKRIEGVQATALNAKRALRELSILRRLGADAEGAKSVALYGAFTRPSPKGPYGMVQGVFKSKGVDLYMVTELATGGDLLSLPGMLTHARVREILSDILQALRLLHSMSVWHRDIKSSNVLVSEGRVMVADFGLARSARHAAAEGGELGEELDIADYERSLAQKKGGSGGRGSPPPPGPPAARPHAPGRAADRALGPNRHQHHFTSAVATPCYRAPECVLSEGYYTGAMDVWGAGCIFAELLSRTAEPGAKPLFTLPLGSAMPGSSEEYAFGATKAGRRHAELDAIFGAIGVPPWRQLEAIRSERWRNFLRRTPGRPGDLRQRFAHAGYLAVDLLERMLAFDPKQRPSAEEALSHAFFSDAAPSHDKQSFLPPLPVLMDDSLWGHDMGRPPDLPEPAASSEEPALLQRQVSQRLSGPARCAPSAAAATRDGDSDEAIARRMYTIRDPAEFLGTLEDLLEARSGEKNASELVLTLIEAECEAVNFEQRGFFFGRKPLWWSRVKERERAKLRDARSMPPPSSQGAQGNAPPAPARSPADGASRKARAAGAIGRRHLTDWSTGDAVPGSSEAWRQMLKRQGSERLGHVQGGDACDETGRDGADNGGTNASTSDWVDGWPRLTLSEVTGDSGRSPQRHA